MCLFSVGRKKNCTNVDAFILAIAVADLLSTMIGPIHQLILFSSEKLSKESVENTCSKIAAFLFDCLTMFEAWLLAEVAVDRLW